MELEDTLTIKKTLNRLGYYKIPSYGLTPYPDNAMFDGLKAYRVSKDDPDPAEIWPGDGFLHHFNTDLRALEEQELAAARRPAAAAPSQGAGPRPHAGASRGHVVGQGRAVPAALHPHGSIDPRTLHAPRRPEFPEGPLHHDPTAPSQPGPGPFGRGVPHVVGPMPRRKPDRPWESVPLPSAATSAPVDVAKMYQDLYFDPGGVGLFTTAAGSVFFADKADSLAEEARVSTRHNITVGNLPPGDPTNNAGDAYRHALWSYLMAKEIGPDAAKRFADAHEITKPNDDGERLMDLYNNEIARRLAADARNFNRPPVEVILEALRNGLLRTKPFDVGKPATRPPTIYKRGGWFDRQID